MILSRVGVKNIYQSCILMPNARSRRNRSQRGGTCASCANSPQQIMTGGAAYDGNAAWGTAVYGAAGQQHAGVGNLIAMNNVGSCGGAAPMAVQSGGAAPMAVQSGGRSRRRRGGVGLATLAVPAALYTANYMMSPRKSKGRSFQRRSRSRSSKRGSMSRRR